MRRRVDRRHALLLGLLLTVWAVGNDLALALGDGGDAPDAPSAEVSPAPGPGPGGPSPGATPRGDRPAG